MRIQDATLVNRRFISVALCTALVSVLTSSLANAENARALAKSVTPSVVLLVMQDDKGQPLSLGSGFVVGNGVVATNLHVVAAASRGYVKLPDQQDKLPIQGTVGVDSIHDLAILRVEGLKAKALALGDSSQVASGDEVYVVGNPQGLEGTFSAGIVSGIRKIGDDSLLQITAPISPGSSGGPVTNSKGEVIGVSVATFKGGQNLNFAIPSRYVAPLLAKPTAITELARAAKPETTKVKSILDELGSKSTDGVEGGSFTWDQFTQSGEYSFSLKNKLQTDVKSIFCLVVFYDEAGEAIDVDLVKYSGLVPAGLAKRVKGKVDDSVEKLNTKIAATELFKHAPPRQSKGRIEFRVLYFQPSDSDERAGGGEAAPVPAQGETSQPRSNANPHGDQDVAAKLKEAEDKLADAVAKLAPAGDGPELIEGKIDGEFQGWNGETIFKLANGQIWQQVSYAYTYHYAFAPKVLIMKVRGAYKMKVDGVDSMIFVKRLK